MDTQIAELNKRIEELEKEFYRGNFSAQQDYTKYSNFVNRIKIPVVTALPATCQIGELISYGGKLYHASAVNTWSSQT